MNQLFGMPREQSALVIYVHILKCLVVMGDVNVMYRIIEYIPVCKYLPS